MRIALISKLWERTDPLSTGGTGMSVGILAEELIKRGHQVSLFATGNSRTKARLISVRQKPFTNDYSEIQEYQNIANAFEKANTFDLIHCHVEHKALFFSNLVKTPVLHSIRYGEFWQQELQLLKKYKKLNFCANSKSLVKKYSFLNWKGFAYNGINVANYTFNAEPANYLLFLGRLSPQKGPDIAIKIAKATKQKLFLAGKISDADKDYLNKKVFPFIDQKNVVYIGEAQFKDKIDLLKNAKALLQPINYYEACSNTILESGACGTPVIAFNKGSNKELIKNGTNGFVVKTYNQMINAVKNINTIKRINCRKYIENNFTVEKMTNSYEKIYKKIV